jgi:hypothetical protein
VTRSAGGERSAKVVATGSGGGVTGADGALEPDPLALEFSDLDLAIALGATPRLEQCLKPKAEASHHLAPIG